MSNPRPYDYVNRQGVQELSWEDVARHCRTLAEGLLAAGADVIVGVARAGLIPATQVALHLRRELFPVRVTRRIDDEVVYASPVWRVPVPAEVAGRAVGVVDEMCDTGETLAMVAAACIEAGAASVITASLVAHSWADPAPDVVALRSDTFVIFPWDREVYVDGRWQRHPEVALGLQQQQQQQQ